MFFFLKRLKKSTREDEASFRDRMQEENVGIKDVLAMLISAFITLVLPCLLVLLVICVVAFLLFI